MANRPIFIPEPDGALVVEQSVEFEWFPGQSIARKQLNIDALHKAALIGYDVAPLEVSTKSTHPLGVSLSAFRLSINTKMFDLPILLEAAYQGSKILSDTGHLTHLYSYQSGRDIKNYLNAHSDEQLVGFEYESRRWELKPDTAFYDWLYVTAVHQTLEDKPEAHDELSTFDAFTDIEFNPKRGINCQARACALYVALSANHLLDQATQSPETFVNIVREFGYGTGPIQAVLDL
jgi:hypothetical protein